MAGFLESRPPLFLAADDIAVSGKLKAAPDALTLGDATMTSAEQTFEGAIEIADPGGRPTVSGTLAAETLALEPLLGPPQRLFDPSGVWSAKRFALAPPKSFDLDLRLSASHLDVYGRNLADAAASLMVTDGKLSMNLIDAAAYGGRVNGQAALACLGDDLKLSARGELTDADLGAALSDFGRSMATGRGAARFSVETFGVSPAAAVAALTGTAALQAADGGIVGVNLEEALRRSQRRPIDVARDMRLGGTAFDKLAVSLNLGNGRAEVDAGRDGEPRRERRIRRGDRSRRPRMGFARERGPDGRLRRGIAERRPFDARHRGAMGRTDDPRDWRGGAEPRAEPVAEPSR